jgi:hypothetical protein
LDFRRAGLSPALSLLMSAFSLLISPAYFSVNLLQLTERSSTFQKAENRKQISISCFLPSGTAASVYSFSPVKSSAQADSTSELLRFL